MLYAEYIGLEKSLEKLLKNCESKELMQRFGNGEPPFDTEFYKDQLNQVRGRINGLQNGWYMTDAEFLGAAGNVYERAVEILNDPVRMLNITLSEQTHLNGIKEKLGFFVQEIRRDYSDQRTYEAGERKKRMNEALEAVNNFVTTMGSERVQNILGAGVTDTFVNYSVSEEEADAMEDFLDKQRKLEFEYEQDKKNWDLQNVKVVSRVTGSEGYEISDYFNVHNKRVEQKKNYLDNRKLADAPYYHALEVHRNRIARKNLTAREDIIEDHERLFNFSSDDPNVFKEGNADYKMASDPDYTNDQWDKADYNGKAELNLNKAVKLLKENNIEWDVIKNLSPELVQGYWSTLTPLEKGEKDPERLEAEKEEMARYQQEVERQEKEFFRQLPLQGKIDKVGKDNAFRYAIEEQGLTYEAVKNELGEAAAEEYWNKAKELSGKSDKVKLSKISRDRLIRDIWDKENGRGLAWAWSKDFDGTKEYWNHGGLTIADKFKLDRQDALDSCAYHKTPFEEVKAGYIEATGIELSKEREERLLQDYYNSKNFTTVAERKALLREEYDRRWNAASWDAKKEMDPERVAAIWENASYEEKKKLSPADAKEFYNNADQEIKDFLDPEEARQQYYRENPLARLHLEEKPETPEMRAFIRKIQKNEKLVRFNKDGTFDNQYRGPERDRTSFELITESLISGNGAISDLWFMAKLVDREKERLGDRINPDLLKIGKICKDLMGEDNIAFFEEKSQSYSIGNRPPAWNEEKGLAYERYQFNLCNAMLHEGKVIIPDNLKNHLTEAVMNFNKKPGLNGML